MSGSQQPPVTTRLWRGADLRDALLDLVRQQVGTLPPSPRLAVVQVGDNPASSAYIRQKVTACNKAGIETEHVHLNSGENEAFLHATLQSLSVNADITGIILQLPLPEDWDTDKALNLIAAPKDVDGLTLASQGLRKQGRAEALSPATPLGVLRILEHLEIPLAGTAVAVIGRGRLVGQPLREMLQAAKAKLIEINKETPQPEQLCGQAQVVCAAAGVPGLVTAAWVKPGATIIDIGLTKIQGKLVGDVNAESVRGIAKVLTASPGGVGPLTVASLLTNVVDAACLQQQVKRPQWRIPPLT